MPLKCFSAAEILTISAGTGSRRRFVSATHQTGQVTAAGRQAGVSLGGVTFEGLRGQRGRGRETLQRRTDGQDRRRGRRQALLLVHGGVLQRLAGARDLKRHGTTGGQDAECHARGRSKAGAGESAKPSCVFCPERWLCKEGEGENAPPSA